MVAFEYNYMLSMIYYVKDLKSIYTILDYVFMNLSQKIIKVMEDLCHALAYVYTYVLIIPNRSFTNIILGCVFVVRKCIEYYLNIKHVIYCS